MKRFFFLAISLLLLVSCETPNAVIIASCENNIYDHENNQGGFVLTVNYKLNAPLNQLYRILVGFVDSQGVPLKDTNNKCTSANGIVCTYCDFVLTQRTGSIRFFMPYEELHIPISFPMQIGAMAKVYANQDEEIASSCLSGILLQ